MKLLEALVCGQFEIGDHWEAKPSDGKRYLPENVKDRKCAARKSLILHYQFASGSMFSTHPAQASASKYAKFFGDLAVRPNRRLPPDE